MTRVSSDRGVLLIYSGGTIGSLPGDPGDPASPLAAAPWDKVAPYAPGLDLLRERHPVDVVQTRLLIDSTNMQPGYWLEMAEIIAANYEAYNGFVILHGTDTMAYTASALSFMLENLAKPVILTGSQLPMAGNCRNDAEQNLYTSVMIANGPSYQLPRVPEVCIFFRDKLLRGNRARKISASGYNGFDSPNYPPLGRAGEHIVIERKYLRKAPEGAFRLRRGLDARVIAFTIFPGVQDGVLLQKVVDLPELRGMVLQSYGTGNAPTEPSFLAAVERATGEKGLIVLDVTQCLEGFVELGAYETGAALLDRGVAGGADITPEAALCKLMVLLGDKDLGPEDIRELVQQNLAGEQSLSVLEKKYPPEEARLQGPGARRRITGEVPGGWAPEQLARAFVRLRRASLRAPEGAPLEIGVYLGLGPDDPLDPHSPHCAGIFRRRAGQAGGSLVFEIGGPALALLRPGRRLSITVALNSPPVFAANPAPAPCPACAPALPPCPACASALAPCPACASIPPLGEASEPELCWQQAELALHLGDWERGY